MTKTVLLAEDEPNIVESLTFLLERAGFEISVATDGDGSLLGEQSEQLGGFRAGSVHETVLARWLLPT